MPRWRVSDLSLQVTCYRLVRRASSRYGTSCNLANFQSYLRALKPSNSQTLKLGTRHPSRSNSETLNFHGFELNRPRLLRGRAQSNRWWGGDGTNCHRLKGGGTGLKYEMRLSRGFKIRKGLPWRARDMGSTTLEESNFRCEINRRRLLRARTGDEGSAVRCELNSHRLDRGRF